LIRLADSGQFGPVRAGLRHGALFFPRRCW